MRSPNLVDIVFYERYDKLNRTISSSSTSSNSEGKPVTCVYLSNSISYLQCLYLNPLELNHFVQLRKIIGFSNVMWIIGRISSY